MIFCILFVLFLALAFYCEEKLWDDVVSGVTFFFAVFFFFIFIGIIFNGVSDYAYLREKRVELQTFVNGVENVRDSYYKQNYNPENAIVSGSIENLNQSTNLSRYVSDVMVKKAEYNSYLRKCQIYESELVYCIIADGFFISEKVQEIQPIE